MRAMADVVPLLLSVIAEAAWISVIGGLVQEYALRDVVLALPQMVVCVAAGVLAARLWARRLGERWPIVALWLVAGAALIGVLAAPAARDVLASDGLAGIGLAVVAHPAGLVAGLALFRGIAYAALPPPEEHAERLLGGGTLAITAAAVLGSIVADPWRARFLADTLVAGVIFAVSALVALALTRQSAIAGDSGADWRRNPAWVGLLVALVVVIAGTAIPAAGLIRPAIELFLSVALLPLTIIGLFLGWTRRETRVFMLLTLAVVLLATLRSLFGESLTEPATQPDGGPGIPDPTSAAADPAVVAFIGGVAIAVALLVALVLLRAWARRSRVELDDVSEERFIDRGEVVPPARRKQRWVSFRGAPEDALAAYQSLLADLAERGGVRRAASETPHEHAARLRREGSASLSLELLAADYALAGYGGVTLSAAENRRAVRRWRSLRRTLRARAEDGLPAEGRPAAGNPSGGSLVDDHKLAPGARAGGERKTRAR